MCSKVNKYVDCGSDINCVSCDGACQNSGMSVDKVSQVQSLDTNSVDIVCLVNCKLTIHWKPVKIKDNRKHIDSPVTSANSACSSVTALVKV